MPAVAIVTDTDASLPKSVSDRYGIKQVPIVVNFGKEVCKTPWILMIKAYLSVLTERGKSRRHLPILQEIFQMYMQRYLERGGDGPLFLRKQ